MKRLFPFMIIILIGLPVFCQPVTGTLIPVTTNSESALSYYNQAMKYLDQVNLKQALETFKKALDKDHDFFMANYQLAFFYLMNKDAANFEGYANAALNCKAKLSDPEELLKNALTNVHQGQTDVTDAGKKLVNMYPKDPNSYNNLVYFQSLSGDSTGMVETLNKVIKIVANPATYYNQLGYAYLTLKQNDKAEEAFNKYIDLDPKNPNVYDSKGDFFMYTKKFDKAYESYMIANSMDPSFSHEKAEIAKQLYEKTEGKKLDIISM